MKFIQGTLYDNSASITSYDISKLNSDNIPLEVKENPPILGKNWPYISVHLIDSKGNVNKDLPNLSGIYAYQHIKDPNKLYVGMSTNLYKRHLTHVKNEYHGTLSSPVFYAAIRKYGWSSFRLLILETTNMVDSNNTKDIASIYNREQFYFDLLRPCYNVNLIAAPGNQGYI
jgi:GIY-YIG catalytic domain-containing protein